jgi:mono/diheme cytochrome c family protein
MRSLSKMILLVAASLCIMGAANRRPPTDTGKRVFEYWCASCHGPGVRTPGTAALSAKYGKDLPAPLELRKDLTPEVVRLFVRQGVSIMPSFRKTEISDPELDALGRYLSHAGKAPRR